MGAVFFIFTVGLKILILKYSSYFICSSRNLSNISNLTSHIKIIINMKLIIKLLLTALAVLVLARILPGVEVASYGSAIIVAIVIALLRLIVKPILVILTLPITILTFGLFLLIINAMIILLAGYFVTGFEVGTIWWALLFSLLLSLFQSVLFSLLPENK